MIRRKTFADNNLFYDGSYLAEDYELWTRAAALTDFANIPEILGEYRIGKDNITKAKKEGLIAESGAIAANNLQRNLGLTIGKDKYRYFQGWENPFFTAAGKNERRAMLRDFKQVLLSIFEANEQVKYYERQALMNAVAAKWRWAKHYESINKQHDVKTLEEIFDEGYKPSAVSRLKDFLDRNRTTRARLQKAASVVRLFGKSVIGRIGGGRRGGEG
jgi:hypothetical protein